jgi:hypothetical protein
VYVLLFLSFETLFTFSSDFVLKEKNWTQFNVGEGKSPREQYLVTIEEPVGLSVVNKTQHVYGSIKEKVGQHQMMNEKDCVSRIG